MGRRAARARATTLEQLYQDRYASFVRVAVALVGRETEAVDFVQEAFARALHSLHQFRSDGTLEAWVWRIVGDVLFGATQRRSYDASTAPFDVDFYGFARDDVSAIRVTVGADALDVPVKHNAFRTTLRKPLSARFAASRSSMRTERPER